MATCTYCGESAGMFRSVHTECREKYENSVAQIEALASSVAETGGEGSLDKLDTEIRSICQAARIGERECRKVLLGGWERALDKCLEDNALSTEEESRLCEFSIRFKFSQSEFEENNRFVRLEMGAALRTLFDGEIPKQVARPETLPFNLQKGEEMVWIFAGVPYGEERVKREYVGGYQGVSVRLRRGLYYRIGGFKGHPVEKSSLELIDAGFLGVTTRHLYSSGGKKSFRVAYSKIVTFVPYSDGLGLYGDTATAKQQIFKVREGWFLYNLVTNLAQR